MQGQWKNNTKEFRKDKSQRKSGKFKTSRIRKMLGKIVRARTSQWIEKEGWNGTEEMEIYLPSTWWFS